MSSHNHHNRLDSSPSPLADFLSFEFESTLPPGALEPSIIGYSNTSPHLSRNNSTNNNNGPSSPPPPVAAAPHNSNSFTYDRHRSTSPSLFSNQQPPYRAASPPYRSPSTYQSSYQSSYQPPPTASPASSRNNGMMSAPTYEQHHSSPAPQYDYDHPPPPPQQQQYQPPHVHHHPSTTNDHSPHNAQLQRGDSRPRALPLPPGPGNMPPASPTAPQRRRALPVPPGAGGPPPSVPPRPPQSYTDFGSPNHAPAARPAPKYEPPAPGPILPRQQTMPPSVQQTTSPAAVQRSHTTSTQQTVATGESFFASDSLLSHNTSVSSRFSAVAEEPKEVTPAYVAHQYDSHYQTYQSNDTYRVPPPRLEEPSQLAAPERRFDASPSRGDRTPSASNSYLPAIDNLHLSDQQPDTRTRTVSGSFDQQPSTPRITTHTLQHQPSFISGPSSGSPSPLPRDPEPPIHLDEPVEIPVQAGSSRQAADAPNTDWAEGSNSRYVQTKLLLHQTATGGYYDDDVYDEYDESVSEGHDEMEEELNEIRFFNPAFLSETAVQLRDRVVRGNHVKGGITWVGTFTGRDLVSTIQTFLPSWTREGPQDRRYALITARSLQSQLWMFEVDWDTKPIRDSSDVVFKFQDEMEGMGLSTDLPSGVLTMATKCYSPSCTGDGKCYAPRCPWKTAPAAFLTHIEEEATASRAPMVRNENDWTEDVDPVILAELSPQQHTRQTLIRQAIQLEERYEEDLGALESVFITPLLTAHPPIIEPYHRLENVIQQLFSNVLEIRRASRRLIDNFAIRLREQSPLITTTGDILLEAATDFRSLYPEYTDNLANPEEILATITEDNPKFGAWLEQVSHQGETRWDLRYLLKRPATYLQKYPEVLAEILKETAADDPDYDFLSEALTSIQNISYLSRLKLFQASKARGPNANLQWHEIVPESLRETMGKKQCKRQMLIWELIQGEMDYVADLDAIDTVFVEPLRMAEQPIIERSRLDIFLDDAFHNYRSLYQVHSRLLENFQERQLEQHPQFGMISDLIMDAALNWHDAYQEYMPHYPIAKAKIDEEKMRNPAFAQFLQDAQRNPLAKRHEINHYTYRPIARLVRYPLLLKEILAAQVVVGPPDHPDIEAIPQVMELIENLAKAGEKGVAVNDAKVKLWQLKTTLDGGKFGSRAVKDLDLLNPMRELIHQGKVFRQPEGTMTSAWSELQLLLFDNYFVLVKQTKSKNKDAPPRYTINRRPIPLELFKVGEFSDPGATRSLGLLKGFRGNQNHGDDEVRAAQNADSRTVFPFNYSFVGQGQLSGQYTLWTDSAPARTEWQEKLNHAKVLRTEVNDAGKVFEMTALSVDTFFQAPGYGVAPNNDDYTGRVTCSVPFVTVDRRSLVAVGCEQGVWIGVRHDPSSLRKVLHVRSVTQIAVLEEFGIFLVLADKSLLAYHLEALVPTAASPQVRSAPQRLSGVRDIVFFCVGQISGRTLVLYMKRKGIDSVFRVLEPILNREAQDRQRRGFGSLLGQRSEWFRVYKDFFIPTEALHVHFLKAKLAIVCAKGFEIMDLTDLKGGAIPIFDPVKTREKPLLAELGRRCDNAKPLAMFRSTDSEFLLCYDAFGIYVDRHGEPNRDFQAIEWEGRPDSVAFHPPYLLLISPSFIEIRHIDSAKLLQIYTGSDIRCTWDGTGGMARPFNDAPGPKGWGDEVTSQEPRVHICKRTDDGRRTRGIGQHIFELTPTLLLNNPLLNPVYTQDPNYFPPAPLDHRTSMGHAANEYNYGGFGGNFGGQPYGGFVPNDQDNGYPIAHDRQSVSSASTNTYPNGMSSPGVQQMNHNTSFPNAQATAAWLNSLETYNAADTLSMGGGQPPYRQTSQSGRAPPYGGGQGGYQNNYV